MSTYIRTQNIEGPRLLPPTQGTRVWGHLVHFWWKASWNTDATSGYIIQEVYTHITQVNCTGQPDAPIWVRYWEAWRITGANTFDPNPFDYWTIVLGANRTGTWVKRANVYHVSSLDPAAGFAVGRVPDARILLSTHTRPQNLGRPLLTRQARGEYNTCGPVSTWYHRIPSRPSAHQGASTAVHAHHGAHQVGPRVPR